MNLLEQTRKMLADTDIPRTRIAKAIDVSPDWLMTFQDGSVDPSYARVQRLHDWLEKVHDLGIARYK